METDIKSFTADDAQHQTLSAEQLAKQERVAVAKELQRADYEARTTARNCLGCGSEFRSEGNHNRMCNRCRSRR